MGVGKMSKKEEAVEQLKNCEEMHIWVKPIKDYIKELEAKEERAKKEHKLVELYQYLNENTNDYDLNPDEVDEIHNKIYEIEEELK